MTAMTMCGATWLGGAVLVAAGLLSAGCVSAEQHRAALADLQRMRTEAWQRGVEAAALRIALDRAAAESARPYAAAPSPELQALAAKLDEVARRQETMAADVRAAAVCAPDQTVAPGSGAQAAGTPAKSRKVTDLLYSRF